MPNINEQAVSNKQAVHKRQGAFFSVQGAFFSSIFEILETVRCYVMKTWSSTKLDDQKPILIISAPQMTREAELWKIHLGIAVVVGMEEYSL